MSEAASDHNGHALRALREGRGISLRRLASEAGTNDGHLSNIEHGRRTLHLDIAQACDRALGTTPLLASLVTGDDVHRRAILSQLGLVAAAPGVAAEAIRAALMRPAEPTDWEAKVDDYGHRLVSDPSPAFRAALLADLSGVQHQIEAGRPSLDLLRAGAGLALIYGLSVGNRGELPDAHRWYASAIELADASRDTDTRAWAMGRALSRGIYEGYEVGQTLAGAEQVLALTSRPTTGAMEAHAARVHVYALTGDVKAGRRAVAGMRAVVDGLPAATLRTLAGPVERTLFLRAFLEARVGSLADAQAACEAALPALAGWPLWAAETRVYLGRAQVAAGDVDAGVAYALATVQALTHDVRVIGVAVRDVLSVVPAGYRTDEVRELARYAHRGPVPWEGLR